MTKPNGRPPTFRKRVVVRLTDAELAQLDSLRGKTSRGVYVAGILPKRAPSAFARFVTVNR